MRFRQIEVGGVSDNSVQYGKCPPVGANGGQCGISSGYCRPYCGNAIPADTPNQTGTSDSPLNYRIK